ncbi:hypothetical protein FRC20_008349 [Serendipita sp. 405]|nr:hypothetical protein FRC20_008349 [Serendipita sp. 405]
MPSSTSGGWFSRSKTSTPAPLPNPPPVEVITPQPITVEATPVQRSDPIPSASNPITEVLPAPSPGRASWFGFARTQPSSLPPTQPNSSPSSALGTPLSLQVDLPAEPSLEESVIDESMMATVTPMSFAQAQVQAEAQTQASRNTIPTSWFKRGGKRDSMTPSIDSTVPSLPPSPKRAIASRHTTLVPVTNSSVYNSSPSSARYTLSSLVLGRPNAAVEGGNHPVEGMQVDTGLNNNPTLDVTALTREPLAIKVIPESEPSSSAVASSAASVSSLNQSSANTSWWPVLPWSSVPNTAAEPKPTTDLSTAMIPAGVQSSAASSIAPSVGEELSKAMLSHGGVDGSISIQPIPNSASWFGFWPWSGQPPITLPEKTEAELIKEAAIARDANIASTPTIVPDAPENYQNPEQNPVSPDTVVNRSSWAYFFSLRSAHGARQITIDVQGEEIMDLDGDPDVPVDTPATGSMAPSVKGKSSAAPSGSASPIPKPRASSTGPAVKRNPPNPPLTDSESIRKKVVAGGKRSSSATPSKRSLPPPSAPKAPNMVLPTFEDTFYTLPRALPPHSRPTPLRKVGRIMSGVFGITNLGGPSTPAPSSEIREWQGRAGVHIPRDYENLRASREVGRDLPRVGEVLGIHDIGRIRDCKRVAILGVHGWFPGTIMRTLFGEPTGTSPKFASMMETAVLEFMEKQGIKLEKLTTMPLEGEGTIDRRVEKLYQDLLSRQDWVDDLHDADVVFVATHSQGSVVSTHLLEKLIADGHLRTSKNWEIVKTVAETSAGGIGMSIAPPQPPQRICCLALCGIHLGPLLYLGTSSIVNPYIQYFESAAARELFEFQDTESAISKKYLAALETVLDHGTKFVYVASLDDQVVPIYSGIFTAVNHPRILRALYIDGDAYSSSDFLSNLLVLLLRMRNAGIDDGGLITHLSEATAGSLSGIGHSTAYLDPGAYKLAVRFLFEASDALGEPPTLEFEPFTAKGSRNDYEIPWALRGLISDPRCQELFGKEIAELRNTFDSWQPKTSALKEVRRKLEPIRGRRSRL